MPDIVYKEQNSLSFEDIRLIIKDYISDAEGSKKKDLSKFALVFSDINGNRLTSEEDALKAAKKDGLFIIPRYSEEPYYIHYGTNPTTGKNTLSY